MTRGSGRFSMSCLMFTRCTAESSLSWRIESDTGEMRTLNCDCWHAPMHTCDIWAKMLYLPCRLLCSCMHTLLQFWNVLKEYRRFPSSSHLHLSFRDESQRIADVILSRKAEFLVFTTYIGHYDRSMSLLEDSCRTSPAFAAIVDQFEVRPAVFTPQHSFPQR